MIPTRRTFLVQAAAAAAAPLALESLAVAADKAADKAPGKAEANMPELPIVDTHQHLWDLERQRLLWLAEAPAVLKHSFGIPEYLEATRGLNVAQAVYMEVDVDPAQHGEEAAHVVGLARSGKAPTKAAVVGGRPASETFGKYVAKLKETPEIRGVRQVLHSESAKPGMCLAPEFVRGVKLLGEAGLSFDLCLRPTELADGLKLAAQCPDMQFILDHCGNADPKAFVNSPAAKLIDSEKPWHEADPWRRDIEALAKQPNVVCKISGIVARAPKDWNAELLAPIVNHCLDSFGPDRVIFGSDWPVCLLGATLRAWVTALREIVAERPVAEQKMLWSENAVKLYRLKAS